VRPKTPLHLYCQIIGKVRLATTAPRNHWWHVPLYVDVRGLTTRRLHLGDAEFGIALDFIDDAVVVEAGDGRRNSFSLAGGTSSACPPPEDVEALQAAAAGQFGRALPG
jgi:hypothetical protein